MMNYNVVLIAYKKKLIYLRIDIQYSILNNNK